MIKKFTLFTFALLMAGFLPAQTLEELISQKEAKEKEIDSLETELADLTGKMDALKGEVAGLTDKITPYPRWEKGAFGTIGLSFAGYNDWLTRDKPNTRSNTIGFTVNAFVNLQQEKYFWRNSGNLNLGWIKFDDKNNPDDNPEFEEATDGFTAASLFGYKLNDKFGISVLGEYRTTILSNFNNPGFLDIGIGGTWTPISNLVVVIHPLNFNFIFADDDLTYTNSLGTKIIADYTRKLPKGISWKSNFSLFLSYKDLSNLSNWTWVNGLSFKVWKGLGIGLELGLRGNKQEAFNAYLMDENNLPIPDDFSIDNLDSDDNPLQIYWLAGFTYGF